MPATISTQGNWCLRKDLSTSITSGVAITIATNHVTIDCNDFEVGGLAAGTGTSTNGIYAESRSNITVRHCALRGFRLGIYIDGGTPGTGHLVEANRLDQMTSGGIYVLGDDSLVRRNRVLDAGGASGCFTPVRSWSLATRSTTWSMASRRRRM